jgi:pimeloyl-ACP methyl ester carboxylesterase
MVTDLVVVLPGILGSTLRHQGRLVWAPSAGSVVRAVTTFGASLTDLRLPDGVGDEHPGDGVEPVDLMPDRHAIPGLWTPVKGYDRLLKRLRRIGLRDGTDPGNLLPISYDWRLSNRHNGQRLAAIVEPALARWRARGGPYADAKVVFVCHSMGGLVARWYVQRCGGADITRATILLGTPYRGALKALAQLANGFPGLLGGLGERLNEFAHSLPSLHQLLPEYACIDRGGSLATLGESPVAGLDTAMVGDAMRFHAQLKEAEQARPDGIDATHLIVGVRQATPTTAQIGSSGVSTLDTYLGEDLAGDATVPMTGATPAGTALDSSRLHRVADKHGNLQRNDAALDQVESVVTSRPIIVRGADEYSPRVLVPELVRAGDPVPVAVDLPERLGIRITVTDEAGSVIESRSPVLDRAGTAVTSFADLPPGAYTIDVVGVGVASPVAPVSSDLVVWPAQRPA